MKGLKHSYIPHVEEAESVPSEKPDTHKLVQCVVPSPGDGQVGRSAETAGRLVGVRVWGGENGCFVARGFELLGWPERSFVFFPIRWL